VTKQSNGCLPWFPFYAADWLLDPAVRGLTVAERGMLIDLLAKTWYLAGALPNEPENLWKMAGAKSRAAFEKSRTKLMHDFELDEVSNTWVHQGLAALWNKSKMKSKGFSDSGKKGAHSRWGKRTDGQAIATPLAPLLPGDSYSESESESQHNKDGVVVGLKLPQADLDACVECAWNYYLEKFRREPVLYELTELRRQVGHDRLCDCLRKANGDLHKAERLMCYAIDRLAEAEWYNGKNERNEKYVDWETHLFGSLEKLEKWLNHESQ
jgi:hypothetical protein